MKKLALMLSTICMLAIAITGCDKPSEQPEVVTETVATKSFDGKTMSVVTTSSKYKVLFDKFTEETGAKVEFLSLSSGEVLSRMRAEGKAMADLWFGGGLDAFMTAKTDGLLEAYISPELSDVSTDYKDVDGYWLSKGITVVGFIVNNKVLADKGLPVPTSWEDIAKPEYKGEVIMSSPAISGTNYAAVKGLLAIFGEQDGWDYITRLNDNIGFYSKRGKDPQEKTVSGEFAIGIIPVDKLAFDAAEQHDLTVIYPSDGIPWVPEGVAIFKDSPSVDVAKAFVDFMLKPENQTILAELDGKDSAQLIKPGVKGLNLGLPQDKLVKQDLSTFGSERQNILDKWSAISSGK